MARPTQPRRTNRYTAEFKLQAVKLSYLDGVQVQDVAEALDIHPYMLSRWRTEARKGLIKVKPKPPPKPAPKTKQASARQVESFARLKRDHELLKREHALLKKAIRFTSARKPTSSRSSSRKRAASG